MKSKVFIVVASLVGLLTVGFLTGSIVRSTIVNIPVSKMESAPSPVASGAPSVVSKAINKLSIPSDQVILVRGEIGPDIQDTIQEIKSKERLGKDLYMLIDSPGGSVLDGARLLSAMEASTSKVHTVCVGMCASMAFIILEHGTTRLALDRAMLMAHPASGGVRGTLEQMNSRLSTISRYVDKMDAKIAARVGVSLETFKAMTVSELWLDSEDALAKKFLDGIVDVNTDAAPTLKVFEPAPNGRQAREKINLNWF